MAPHAIASASVSFGLVSIPVKVYSASQSSSDVSFHLLHRECGSRLKQQYVCAKDGSVVERAEMVKGYEFAKGQYVLFSPEELKALEERETQSVEITEFVPAEKIDPIWFDKAYYLGPDKGGERAYRLLGRAMEETRRWALAKYAARGKQHLVLVRPIAGGGLAMQQLHYADEIRPFSEVGVAEAEVKEAELKLAVQLTEQVSAADFRPESYSDEAKQRVLALIAEKVAGREITVAEPPLPAAPIIDLMEALKASIARRQPAAKEPVVLERKPAKRAARVPAAAAASEPVSASSGGRARRRS